MMIVSVIILFTCALTARGQNDSEIVCGKNEVLVQSKTTCPPQSCDLAYTEYLCDPNPKPAYNPGCDCIPDYLRNENEECIFNEDCPYPFIVQPQCGDFEELVTCEKGTSEDCVEQCKCIENYVRDTNGTCIYIECGYNEVASEVKQTCPPQDCFYSPKKYACKPGPPRPGCNCIGDYLRNSSGVCVPKDQCDSESEENTTPEKTTYYARATSYAHASSSSSSSSASSSAYAKSSARTKPGNNPITENPKCNGDRNASYTECPNPCKSTCANPNATPCNTQTRCAAPACQCEPLYLLSDDNLCIAPDDCPGGNPCSQNETFIYCNAGCPTNYCPQTDSRAEVACGQPSPCPSGCGCKVNYKRLSYKDDRCILASDCPPVNCTRQNEVWNSCTPPCFSDSCPELVTQASECPGSAATCKPQCVCASGYFRNIEGVCVAKEQCSAEA